MPYHVCRENNQVYAIEFALIHESLYLCRIYNLDEKTFEEKRGTSKESSQSQKINRKREYHSFTVFIWPAEGAKQKFGEGIAGTRADTC